MDAPKMFEPSLVAQDTFVLPSYFPIPGIGLIPNNAFLIRSAEPILVDTGVTVLREEYHRALTALIDPADIRWVYLTHTDQDHVGLLDRVLAEAPRATLVTTFLGLGKLGLQRPVDPGRVRLLNPGQRLVAGDRTLVAVRPPTWDAPETTGVLDTKNRVLFSADSFGAIVPTPAEAAGDIAPEAVRQGLVTWATVDSPWLHDVDARTFERACNEVREMAPETILSAHLPPAPRMTDILVDMLLSVQDAPRWVAPDQEMLKGMLATAAGPARA